jgi:propanediol dehydratase large subunit
MPSTQRSPKVHGRFAGSGRSLADFNVPREQVLRRFSGLTPAKLTQVVNRLNVVEMMMAMQKMRARRTPSNQAHVTNRKEHPALLAADAAEAVERGFAELETTVGVARYAPLNALALLVGSQTGGGTALTQCAVEEALSLQLALLGLTITLKHCRSTGRASFRRRRHTWSKAFLRRPAPPAVSRCGSLPGPGRKP